MRVYNRIRGFASMVTLGVFMIFVSNYIASTDALFRGAAFAGQRQAASKVSSKRQAVPPEWDWFKGAPELSKSSKKINKVNSDEVCKVVSPEVKRSATPNASFELAYAKMLKLKSLRTERDKQILANIKASDKSSSMSQMNRKIREIRSKAIEARVEEPIIKPASKQVTKKYQKTDRKKRQLDETKAVEAREEIIEKANAIMSTVSTVAIPNVSPNKTVKLSVIAPPREPARFTEQVPALDLEDFAKEEAMSFVVPEMDLNEIVAIDDMLAIDTAPPAIEAVAPVVKKQKQASKKSYYQKSGKNSGVEAKQAGYNRYAPEKPETIETLYRGANSVYSPRINELVNERKDKIFGTN